MKLLQPGAHSLMRVAIKSKIPQVPRLLTELRKRNHAGFAPSPLQRG